MQKRLLSSGNVCQRSDRQWSGTIWYKDEVGKRHRKTFSGATKREVNKKLTEYITAFCEESYSPDEKDRPLRDSMQSWLEMFKFPSVERTTYDRCECTVRNQIYPILGNKRVSKIKSRDIKALLNQMMYEGYAYTTVKKVYHVLGEYFRYLVEQEVIEKSPMNSVPMMKKNNFFSAQGREVLPVCDTITVFTSDEIKKLKAEAFRCWGSGKRIYQQAAAYVLLLNTGLRTGELLGLQNKDVDLDNRVLHVRRGVKEIERRSGTILGSGREVKVGKLKSVTSKRDVPLNSNAVEMIEDLRRECYHGEDAPLVCNEYGGFTRPVNFRKRFYRILRAAGIEKKGLHSLRHTFASYLINGQKQPDGSIHSLTPKQVADLLGHSTSQITEMYYVKRDLARLEGITDAFNL